MNPATAVRRLAQLACTRTAIVADGRARTYGELHADVETLASHLSAGGLSDGDRVAYLGRNSALFMQTLLAAARLGAIFVPVNFRLTPPEVEQVLADADCHSIVYEDDQLHLAESLSSRLGSVWMSEAGLALDTPMPAAPVATTNDDDIAVILYTSGTTGRPKGVVLTYGNLWWNNANVAGALPVAAHTTCLAVAPLFHVGGLNAFALGALMRGGTVVVHRTFDPALCLRDIAQYRVTSTFMVPTMFDALRRDPGWATVDLSSLSCAVVAGAPVPRDLVLGCAADGVVLQQAWGLTETAPFASYLPADLATDHPDSAGYPMPYSEVAVRAADGTLVTAAGVEGELCVRGPQVTSGYWRDPAATAAVIDADGWFASGDLGRFDAAGRYYVVDRIKDLIISGGENVSPAEVENVLIAHPDVRDVAVVGMPHDRWGSTVVAAVAGDAGATPSLPELREFAAARLAGYKLPTVAVDVATVPRNGSGKIDRAAVRALVQFSRRGEARDVELSTARGRGTS